MFLIIKLLFKNKDLKKAENSIKLGKCASIFGIFLNLLLCIIKISIGLIFQVNSLFADGLNNLTDIGSSLISLLSFYFSSKPADEEHPFGHERIEYVFSLIVSFIIMLFAYNLFLDGIDGIINSTLVKINYIVILALIISILVKIYMYFYNTKYGKIINSSIMKATALDSLSDVYSSSAILIALIVSKIINFNLDGYLVVIVSILIFKSAIEIIKENVYAIIGENIDKEFIAQVIKEILKNKEVKGYHDLIVHSYGKNKRFMSIHIEVDSELKLIDAHNIIDYIEYDIKRKFNIEIVCHLDPVVNNKTINSLKNKVLKTALQLDNRLSIHDFRIVECDDRVEVFFDLVIPFNFPKNKKEIQTFISNKINENNETLYNFNINIENSYL